MLSDSGANDRTGPQRVNLLLAGWAVAVVLLGAMILLALGKVEFWVVLALHGACVLLTAGIALALRKSAALFGLAFLLLVLVALAGAFGAAVWGLALAPGRTRRPFRSGATAFAPPDWDDVDDAGVRLHHALNDGRLRIEGASTARSLRDILAQGSQPEKLRALGVMARKFTPALLPALRVALKDDDSAVRVLATSIQAVLEARHVDLVKARRHVTRTHPNDGSAWIALATAHADFAGSGLIPIERRRTELKRAQHAATAARIISPKDTSVARLLQALERALAEDEVIVPEASARDSNAMATGVVAGAALNAGQADGAGAGGEGALATGQVVAGPDGLAPLAQAGEA